MREFVLEWLISPILVVVYVWALWRGSRVVVVARDGDD